MRRSKIVSKIIVSAICALALVGLMLASPGPGAAQALPQPRTALPWAPEWFEPAAPLRPGEINPDMDLSEWAGATVLDSNELATACITFDRTYDDWFANRVSDKEMLDTITTTRTVLRELISDWSSRDTPPQWVSADIAFGAILKSAFSTYQAKTELLASIDEEYDETFTEAFDTWTDYFADLRLKMAEFKYVLAETVRLYDEGNIE